MSTSIDRIGTPQFFTSTPVVAAQTLRPSPYICILPRAVEFNGSNTTVAFRYLRLDLLPSSAAFAIAINHLDRETCEHSIRVARMAVELTESLSNDAGLIEMIWIGALLHDIGKACIRASTLDKVGLITKNERELLNRHPSVGAQLLMSYNFPSQVINMVHYHHERFDGEGYPVGLYDDQIPFAARVLAVVDTFDAMTSTRPYRHCATLDQAIHEIVECAGSQFDPNIASNFVNLLRRKSTVYTPQNYSIMSNSLFATMMAEG